MQTRPHAVGAKKDLVFTRLPVHLATCQEYRYI